MCVSLVAKAQTDITDDYLTNANLGTVDTGWSYYSDAFKYTDWKTDGDVPVVEFYSQWNEGNPISITQKDFKFSQTITLPAGDYRIAVNAFYRNGNGDGTNPDKAWIFAGENKQNVYALTSAGVASYTGSNDLYKAANAFSKGNFSNAFDFSLDEETEIEVGFQGFFNTSLSWCILGPVKLYKYTLDDYLADYQTYVDAAQALYDSQMDANVLAALKAAVVDKSTFTKSSEVTAAIATLNEATIAANNSIADYARVKTLIDAAKTKAEALDADGKAAFNITSIETAYADGSIENIDEAISGITTALATAVKAQTTAGADFTGAIINNGFEFGNTDGWTTIASNDTGARSTSNDIYKTTGSTGDWLFNTWSKGTPITQAIEGLPNGIYRLGASLTTNGGGMVFLTANGGHNEGEACDDASVFHACTYEFEVTDGTATIGAIGGSDTGYVEDGQWWYKADDFQLTLVRTIDVPTNLDFSATTPEATGIRTYAKDIKGDEKAQALEVDGWTIAANGDARATGVVAYGSGAFLGGEGYEVPAVNPEGKAEGNALGLVGVWDALAQYTQKATFKAGKYVITVPVFNAVGGASVPQKSLIGFTAEGTEYLAEAKAYPVNAWTYETITFDLDELTDGQITLGYDGQNVGSAAAQHLFFDKMDIQSFATDEERDAYIATLPLLAAKATLYNSAAVAAAMHSKNTNVGEGLFQTPESAAEPLAQAAATAQTAANSEEATLESIASAQEDLDAAIATYKATFNVPDPEKAYAIANTTATGNLSIETGAIKVKTDATVYFTAVEGGYVLSNEAGDYILKTTANDWTLSTTTDITQAYKVNFNIVEGGYTIQGEKGLFGLDNTDEGSAVYANKTAAKNGIWTIAEYVEPGPEPVIADLTQAMFFDWDGVDAEAQKTSDTPTGCDYNLNTSTDMVYGTSTVTHTKYADLSEWDYLTIAAPQGTPRLQFNRKTADGQDHVKIPDNAEDVEKYIKKSEDGTFVYNLAAIKAVWGFVHLNAIKTSGGPGIIQEMKLSTVKPYEPTWYTISVAEGIENGTVEATLTKSVAGAPVSVTATPAEGFELKAIKYTAEGEEPTTQEGTTFTMPAANVTVSATFTKAPEYIVSDLTKAMFHDWSAADGTAEIITEEAACDYAIGDVEAKAEGVALYGNGSVLGQSFADLSEYKSLALDVESGAIRIMLNTVGQEDPKTFIELNQGSSKSYFSINNKTWTIDLDKFKQVENVEYVHLNVIKVAWGSSAAISAAKLTKLAEETPTLYTITIAETENGTVATDVEEAAEGATVTVTVTPNDGFMVDEVSLTYGEGQKVEFDGEPTENEGVLSATFTMPAGNVNVGFTFKKVEYDITVSGATPSEEPGAYLVEGGKISISSDAFEGEQVTLSLGPDEGYEVESVSVTKTADGSEVQLIQDPEHQTNWTFIMPGEAVTVTAAFKKTSVEPTPTIAATLVHTAASFCGDPAGVFTSTVDAEAEHVNNSNFGAKWAGAAYADFSLATLPAGATITKATLTFTGIGESRNARNTNVQYVNQDLTLDYTALSAGNANVNLAATDITSVSFPKYTEETKSQEFKIDVTDFVKDIAAKQNYIIFKWTGNQGGGDVAGKASENAPTLVIEYIPGAPEIANWSFDENPEDVITVTTQGYVRNIPEGSDQITGLQPVTGWTPVVEQTAGDPGFSGGVFAYGSENLLNNKVTAPATAPEDSESPSALALSAVWDGIAQYTQEVTLPAGDYKFTYTAYNGANTGAVTKNLFGFVAGDGTAFLSDQKTFPVGEWNTYEVAFTVDAETTGNISVGFQGAGGSGAAPHLFVDNVTLEKVPGIEIALIDLKKAIEAAEAKKATYGIGEGLFQYPESEIEPLAQAITTAQAAYDAAESKAAVEAATAAINGAVEAFAPAMTAPDPEKKYILTLQTSDEASPFELSVSTEGIKIVATEEGTPITFVAQEGGSYALSNGTEYLNYKPDGNKWDLAATTDAYGWTIAALPDGGYSITGKNGLFGTNTSNGNAVNSPCYGDKNTGNGNYIWNITEYVEPTEKTIEIAIERMVGLGYSEQNETMDFAEAAEFLGVEAVTNDMLRVMKSDNTLTDSYGTYDGWFNKEGFAETWGANSFINIKLWRANDEGKYSIQDMGGDQGAAVPAVGDKVTVKWAAVANEKTVFFNFNVTFVEIPVPELTISDVKVQKDVIYDNTVTGNYAVQTVELTNEEVQSILTELNLTSLDEAKVYGYNPSDESFVVAFAGFDGWRDANGDFAMHTGTTDVPACCKYTDGKSYPCYNIAGVGDKIVKTYWAIANDEKAVLVEVDFWFGDAYTGIDGIAAGGKTMKNGRKYMENGKIFIYRNGKKYSTTGVELK